MSNALLRVEGLAKQFAIQGSDAVVSAIGNVSFEIGRGETLGLVGESGSGKTTVGRCLLKLIHPTAGRIYYQEEEITHLSEKLFFPYRRTMQMVFQEPHYSLNPRYSARETLAEPLMLGGERNRTRLRDRIAELVGQVHFDPKRLESHPHEMSNGEQQRLAIARALATGPNLIVLDEPTSALDLSVRADIIDLLIELQSKTGVSYLFISHDLTTVEYLCHRVAVMYLGEIVETGTAAQVFGSPRHPYSKALLSSALLAEPKAKRSLYILRGEIPSPVNLPRACYLASRCPEVGPRCRDEPQVLAALGDGRAVRCWRVSEGAPLGRERQ